MATYWTLYEDKWHEIDDDVDLKRFAYRKLHEESNMDSDGGYWVSLVFWRNGIMTYAMAEYDCYDDQFDMCGEINHFAYGTLEEVQESGGWWSKHIQATKLLPPNRDWIKI